MNQTNLFVARPVAFIAALTVLALGAVTEAQAKITAFLAAGATCEGGSSASFTNGGPAVKVSLCVTTTTERLCGHTNKLQAAEAAENGRFHIIAIARGPIYADPNSEPSYPVVITKPPAITDFGATVAHASFGPAANQLLVTFDISPQANATEDAYTINLAPISSVGVSADGVCTLPMDAPIAASFSLLRRPDKETKK